jgi:DNA gyrase subunit A
LFFGCVRQVDQAVVATVAGSGRALAGTDPGAAKVTPLDLYPPKGRATGGVRCQRFLKGEDRLLMAWVGPEPAKAVAQSGKPVELPPVDPRRDGSGRPLAVHLGAIG